MDLKKITVDGVQLAVRDQGSGEAVLLVHGFPLDHTMWRQQWEPLSARYRVIIPDLRGFGQSEVTAGTVTMAQFADDLAKLLDALRVPTVTYCGLSMGGYIGWEFWRRHRPRVSRMILCDTRAAADTEIVVRGRHWMARRVCDEGPGFVPETMLPKLFAPQTLGTPSDVVDQTRRTILTSSAEGIAAAQRGMAQRRDATAMLSSLDVPTLLIAGTHDVISPPAEIRQIADAVPEGAFIMVERSGHLPPLENPDDFNQAVLTFLSG